MFLSGSLSTIGLKTHSQALTEQGERSRCSVGGNSGAGTTQASTYSLMLCCKAGYSHLPGSLPLFRVQAAQVATMDLAQHLLHPSPTVTQVKAKSETKHLKYC